MLGSLIALLLAPASGIAPLLSFSPFFGLALLEPERESLSARTSSTATASLSAEWLELTGSASVAVATTTTATAAPVIVVSPPEPESPPTSARLRLVYTGGTGGIGSGRYDFSVARDIAASVVAAGGKVLTARPYHGTLAQGLHVLIAADRRIASAVRFLDEGSITCSEPAPARSIRTGKNRLLVEGTFTPPWVSALGGAIVVTAYDLQTCTSAGGTKAWLYGPTGRTLAPDRMALRFFETRLSLLLSTTAGRDIEIVGIPTDDPARRYRELRALVREGDVLYVDTGSFLDGTSTTGAREGQLSRHRPLGLEILAGLRPSALAPAETELAGGAANLLAEKSAYRLPYVATNWRSREPELALPRSIRVTAPTPIGPVSIAFLGAVDPAIAAQLPGLADEGVTLEDPLTALDAEVQRLHTSTAPPDLLVVLTSARWEVYEAIQANVPGIDLVIGETSPIENRTQSSDLVVTPTTSQHRLSAGILPIIGATVADLDLARTPEGRSMIERVRVESRRMTERLEPDPELMARITATRARLYPALDRVLVRPPGGPTDPLSQHLWTRLVCESVRSFTGADVVLLPELPPVLEILGPQTELLALNSLGVFDKLERHVVRGTRLPVVLEDAPRITPVACGGQTGRGALVLGRPIEPARSYVVVSTDRARINGLGTLIGADGYGTRILDPKHHELVLDEHDEPVSLRTAVLTELRELRDAGGDQAAVAALAERSENTIQDAAFLRVNRLSLLFSAFVGAEERALPEVRDTRANAPSALTLGGDVDLQLVIERSWVNSDLRLRAQYNRLEIDDAAMVTTVREQADDIRVSTSVGLPYFRKTLGPFTVMPFGEVLFDSEFTPVDEDADRQAALFLVGGLAWKALPYLTSLRIGAAASRDFATELPYAFVLRTDGEANIAFGYDLAAKVLLDGSWFAPTDGDDATTLRFRYALEGRLALPLARWLAIGAYARAFVFQGAGLNVVAASYDLGFSLDITGAFAL